MDERVLHLHQLGSISRISNDWGLLEGDYMCCVVQSPQCSIVSLDQPLSFSGLATCLIINGKIEGEIETEKFTLGPGSIFSFSSSDIVRIHHVDWASMDARLMVFSPSFLRDLNIDLNAIDFQAMMSDRPEKVMNDIPPEHIEAVKHYFELLLRNAQSDTYMSFAKNIARSVAQAFTYQMLQLRSDRTKLRLAAKVDKSQTRQVSYVQEFMRLLRIHHTHERSLRFYADKLCISSKYLSHLIKETTGTSAAIWIGQFVVQEAKNRLKYSNKNVQQVAYDLNFPSQSSFGKYFKNITGISPSEFKKT